MIMARAINYLVIQTDLGFQNAKYLKLIAVGWYRSAVMTYQIEARWQISLNSEVVMSAARLFIF
jgi:hypothetical protein